MPWSWERSVCILLDQVRMDGKRNFITLHTQSDSPSVIGMTLMLKSISTHKSFMFSQPGRLTGHRGPEGVQSNLHVISEYTHDFRGYLY